MKNFILSTALVLGALSVNASNSLDAPNEFIVEDGCTTTTETTTTQTPGGTVEIKTTTVTTCD